MSLVAVKIAGGFMGVDLVVSTTPIKVFNIFGGVWVATLLGVFNLEDNDGNIIMTLSFSGVIDTFEIEETWIASNGLTVKASHANNTVIVMYSDEV